AKIRVYTISDQDDSGPWMRREFPNLFYVVSPGGERSGEYYQATWTGISGDKYYLNGPEYRFDLVTNNWLDQNIRTGHGPLGAMYPNWEYIMEGDTPSYMNLINNGLGSHISPGYGGWGGRYAFKQTYQDAVKIWQNTRDRVVTPDGQVHMSNTATIWRWREAFQHDFAARLDWCVQEKTDANHNPVVVVEADKTKNVLTRTVRPGEQVTLDAAGTSDPDGDELTYRWFHYSEAGLDVLNVRDQWSAELKAADTSKVTINIPEKRPRNTSELHIVLDVTDDGQPSLHAYRRVIFKIVE
ncbi:MAG: nucleoside hydrolase-like domain-containing protein, partial [Planctomycetota bacterium]